MRHHNQIMTANMTSNGLYVAQVNVRIVHTKVVNAVTQHTTTISSTPTSTTTSSNTHTTSIKRSIATKPPLAAWHQLYQYKSDDIDTTNVQQSIHTLPSTRTAVSSDSIPTQSTIAVVPTIPLIFYHKRFGPVNIHTLKQMSRNNTVAGLPALVGDSIPCDTCLINKQVATPPHNQTATRRDGVGDLIHMDIGFMNPSSSVGHVCYLVSVDDYSRHVTVIWLWLKSQTTSAVQHYINWFERQTGKKVKELESVC